MTDHIAVIRETIDFAQRTAAASGVDVNAKWGRARASLIAIESEFATFRENALDLSAVPPERYISAYYTLADGTFCICLADQEGKTLTIDGAGPTPSAALAAAIARIGK